MFCNDLTLQSTSSQWGHQREPGGQYRDKIRVSRWQKCPLLSSSWPWTSTHFVTPVRSCQHSPHFFANKVFIRVISEYFKENCDCDCSLGCSKGQRRDEDSICVNISRTLTRNSIQIVRKAQTDCPTLIYWNISWRWVGFLRLDIQVCCCSWSVRAGRDRSGDSSRAGQSMTCTLWTVITP